VISLYTNFYKIRDIIDSLSSHIDYAQDCLDDMFTLGNSIVTFDSYTKNATIMINNDVHHITDKFLLSYMGYNDYIFSYDTKFDGILDFFYAFLNNFNVSFLDMSSNVNKIVEFRKSFGFDTDSASVGFLQGFFMYIHIKLSELDNL
jgi:hypothetical protein